MKGISLSNLRAKPSATATRVSHVLPLATLVGMTQKGFCFMSRAAVANVFTLKTLLYSGKVDFIWK
jgi:hypothetical protein